VRFRYTVDLTSLYAIKKDNILKLHVGSGVFQLQGSAGSNYTRTTTQEQRKETVLRSVSNARHPREPVARQRQARLQRHVHATRTAVQPVARGAVRDPLLVVRVLETRRQLERRVVLLLVRLVLLRVLRERRRRRARVRRARRGQRRAPRRTVVRRCVPPSENTRKVRRSLVARLGE